MTNNNNSICEKSMKLMTNIVKLSYISIATIGLRTHAPSNSLAQATHNHAPSHPLYPKNLRPQEPIVKYLVSPGGTRKSNMSMIKDDENVDRNAGDFINKVRAKYMKDANEMTNIYESILPPPPPHYMLQSSSSSSY
ncbi:hypothetical protein QVD17_38888 [Tagetes erecta]|uniref:Uncharacterized protein n=1 Tax=Tagetes erecta TaxID=13708 RepID=A0AAD8JMM0_TARER|nr:hypothetical protein QVD17_38888 [Tagetes erecta]